MIGFFEHQFVSYKKKHMRNLVALAKADGHLHEDEQELLYRLGEQYGLKEKQINQIIISQKEHELFVPDSDEDKLKQLYDIAQMVYADGVVDDNEVAFCENVVDRFGYKKAMVSWLLEMFGKKTPPHPDDWDKALDKVRKEFLK